MLLEAYHRQQLGLNQKATGNGIMAWRVVMITCCLQRPGWLRDDHHHEELESQKTTKRTHVWNINETSAASILPYISKSLPQPNCAGHVTPEIDNPYPGPVFL